MARKKVPIEREEFRRETTIPTPIARLTVDYPNEGLNNMARKINEIIDLLNESINN